MPEGDAPPQPGALHAALQDELMDGMLLMQRHSGPSMAKRVYEVQKSEQIWGDMEVEFM